MPGARPTKGKTLPRRTDDEAVVRRVAAALIALALKGSADPADKAAIKRSVAWLKRHKRFPAALLALAVVERIERGEGASGDRARACATSWFGLVDASEEGEALREVLEGMGVV